MILAKEAGDGGMPMARTARAAFTKSSPVPVWLQYFEKCSIFSQDTPIVEIGQWLEPHGLLHQKFPGGHMATAFC